MNDNQTNQVESMGQTAQFQFGIGSCPSENFHNVWKKWAPELTEETRITLVNCCVQEEAKKFLVQKLEEYMTNKGSGPLERDGVRHVLFPSDSGEFIIAMPYDNTKKYAIGRIHYAIIQDK